jgi:hypothetical protein
VIILDKAPLYPFCTTSIPGAESLVDMDVSGDGSVEGLTFSFDDDEPTEGALLMPPEDNHDRLACIEDELEGHEWWSNCAVWALFYHFILAGKGILLWLHINPFFVIWAVEKIRIQSNDLMMSCLTTEATMLPQWLDWFLGYVVKFFELPLRTLAISHFAPVEILNIGRFLFPLNGHSLFSTRKINNHRTRVQGYRLETQPNHDWYTCKGTS